MRLCVRDAREMAWCSQRGVKAHDGLVGSARGSPSIMPLLCRRWYKGFLFALAKIFLKQCAIYSYCGKCASRHGKGDMLHWVYHIAASVDAGNACLPEVIYFDRSKIGKFAA